MTKRGTRPGYHRGVSYTPTEGVIVEEKEVLPGFLDKAGLSIVLDMLKLEPRLVLHARDEDGTTRAYVLVENGLWLIAETPLAHRQGAHTIEFLPFTAMREIVATLTSNGREALLSMALTRFYAGLASTNLEIRPVSGPAWTIRGKSLAEGASSDADERLSEMLAGVFELCRAASESGVAVRIVSPGDLEDLPPKVLRA